VVVVVGVLEGEVVVAGAEALAVGVCEADASKRGASGAGALFEIGAFAGAVGEDSAGG
jgi:hypothetical protein